MNDYIKETNWKAEFPNLRTEGSFDRRLDNYNEGVRSRERERERQQKETINDFNKYQHIFVQHICDCPLCCLHLGFVSSVTPVVLLKLSLSS